MMRRLRPAHRLALVAVLLFSAVALSSCALFDGARGGHCYGQRVDNHRYR